MGNLIFKIKVRKIIFFLSFFLLFVQAEINADYFKWEILIALDGFGSEIKKIPVFNDGNTEFFGKGIMCRTDNFWTRIESELLLEGKTLICKNDMNERKISLVCRDNNRNRKYNNFKRIYPVSKYGLLLNPNLGSGSTYIELRCYF